MQSQVLNPTPPPRHAMPPPPPYHTHTLAPHLELQLPPLPLAIHRLSQADGPPVPQLPRPVPKLVPAVALCIGARLGQRRVACGSGQRTAGGGARLLGWWELAGSRRCHGQQAAHSQAGEATLPPSHPSAHPTTQATRHPPTHPPLKMRANSGRSASAGSSPTRRPTAALAAMVVGSVPVGVGATQLYSAELTCTARVQGGGCGGQSTGGGIRAREGWEGWQEAGPGGRQAGR